MWMKVKKLMENAKTPTRAHDTDAGLDVYCVENEVIREHSDKILKTGISIAIPDGWVAVVKEKSGIATKNKVTVGACVIDSGYRGELLIHLFNNGDIPATFIMGNKIAQLLIVPCWTGQPEEVENLDDTPRGDGGFGSTDSIDGKRSGDIVNIAGTDCMLLGDGIGFGELNMLVGKTKPHKLSRRMDTPEWKKKYAGMTFDDRSTNDMKPQCKYTQKNIEDCDCGNCSPRKTFTDEELTQIVVDMFTQLGNEVAEIYRKAYADFKPETRDDWK